MPDNPATAGAAVLVTGGAGFIGSHLVDSFLALGRRVIVLDDLSTGDRERVAHGARLVEADLVSAPLENLLADEKVELVLHHAAQVDVRTSVADPMRDAQVNVLGTIRLAQACVETGVSQVVFASSGGAIYGEPEGERADEDHPMNPCSPYGVAKLAGEKYLLTLTAGSGTAVTILRYANVYGPRQDGRGEAGVVGIWMSRLLGGADGVINGDGEQTRDFVHVADVVAVNRAAAERRTAGVYNVGTGVETSVNVLYDLVAKACGVTKPARRGGAKPGEQKRSVLDPSLCMETFGIRDWVPLAEGLKATAEWFRMHRVSQGL